MVAIGQSGFIAAAIGAAAMTVSPAQQEVWRFWPHLDRAGDPEPYDDFDGDGVRDLLITVAVDWATVNQLHIRILSGATGTLLYQHNFSNAIAIAGFTYLGDGDGDGHGEYAITMDHRNPCCPNRV